MIAKSNDRLRFYVKRIVLLSVLLLLLWQRSFVCCSSAICVILASRTTAGSDDTALVGNAAVAESTFVDAMSITATKHSNSCFMITGCNCFLALLSCCSVPDNESQ